MWVPKLTFSWKKLRVVELFESCFWLLGTCKDFGIFLVLGCQVGLHPLVGWTSTPGLPANLRPYMLPTTHPPPKWMIICESLAPKSELLWQILCLNMERPTLGGVFTFNNTVRPPFLGLITFLHDAFIKLMVPQRRWSWGCVLAEMLVVLG